MTKLEEERSDLWCDVVLAVIRSDNCDKANVAIQWADHMLEQYDKRFGPEALEKAREKAKTAAAPKKAKAGLDETPSANRS